MTCDECGAEITDSESAVSLDHAKSCSLHPDNVHPRDDHGRFAEIVTTENLKPRMKVQRAWAGGGARTPKEVQDTLLVGVGENGEPDRIRVTFTDGSISVGSATRKWARVR